MLIFLKSNIHHFLGVIVVVSHASEIGNVMGHLTWWHILAAILVFAVWYVTRTKASESEIV